MDATKFDAVARLLVSGLTRREAMRGLVVGAGAVAAGGIALEAASAKKKKRCKRAGAPCSSDRQCCTDKTKRICEVPVNGSNSDTYCCGGAGAKCGAPNEDGDDTAPFCCVGFECRVNPGDTAGVCRRVPDDE